MRESVLLKRLSGSKANTTERVAVTRGREITVGRDADCDLRYDDDRGSLVSRKHLKIVAGPENPPQYSLTDMGSRNGTLVNGRRVAGPVCLAPGDRVQLGAGGPEFEFRLERSGARAAKPPRRKRKAAALAMLFLLAGAAAGAYVAKRRGWLPEPGTDPKPPSGLAAVAANRDAVVEVRGGWSVVDAKAGAPVAQAYISNERPGGAGLPLIEGAPPALPAFVVSPPGAIEPLLAPAKMAGAKALGGDWRTFGLIARDAGRVLAPAAMGDLQRSAYRWPRSDSAGALLVLDRSSRIVKVAPLAASQFPKWAPADGGVLADDIPPGLTGRLRSRRVRPDALRADVRIELAIPGRSPVAASVAGESGGLAALAPVETLTGLHAAPVAFDAAPPEASVYVASASAGAVAAKVAGVTPAGPGSAERLRLDPPACSEGGVVFDPQGRALAICASPAAAIPVRAARELLQ